MHPDRRLVALQLAVGLAVLGFGWGTSLAGVEPVRGYWFDFVWAGYILAGDAVVWRRAGRSLLHGGGWRVVALFALSAPLWWAFEIANWRLENWKYVGTAIYGGQAHVLLKTLSFVFVLPALATSRDLLRSFVRFPHPPAVPLPSWTTPVLVAAGLICVPLLYFLPDQTYPLVWVAPLLVLDGVADLRGRRNVFALLREGHAGPVLLIAVAGLGTGILWELWNWGAVPHWDYRIPYLGLLPVFEMPILGYLGYPPFALVADAFVRTVLGGRGGLTEEPVTDLGEGGSRVADPVTN
ncbi:MAG TPA: hypothetical protein VF880_19270 [Actinomycetes bacterium]